jgi:putative ABC transport system substrate-binding protein
MSICLRRRDFIAGLGGAAAWPLPVPAQQQPIPTIGFLSPERNGSALSAALSKRLLEMLLEVGYVEGQNVKVEYRWTGEIRERQREFAAELVRRQVAVILARGGGPASAAKRATSTIPIVFFQIASDPVKFGLVASVSRPEANITGVGFDEFPAKEVELLCQLVPTATKIAYLSGGPGWIAFQEERPIVIAAADRLSRQLIEVKCPSKDALGESFATMIERGAGAVIVSAIALFNNNADEIVRLAERHKIPAIYPGRLYVLRGGLMSYTSDLMENFRIAVGLVGEILKGAKPADLPVRNPNKFDFVINLKTAKQLGLEIPPNLLVFANELIN